ncbi:MAG: ADP-glyceromanno-heptose 6-epimerase [Rhodospirillaceae bacterium]|nr:MAG: ADP-glyceromanno-heptose 6-epimerase [Rhodospirillaceae bacterium]
MILVTGGAGFIGSNLLAGLEACGQKALAVCDRLNDGEKWQNLAKRDHLETVHPEDLFTFLESHRGNIEAIFHLGAISDTTVLDKERLLETNFRLSVALWEHCIKEGIRFFYASSAATYGDGSQGFDDDGSPEALAKLQPLNPYGWSKHLFDQHVAKITHARGPTPPQWAGLKFFNVYGPNEGHKGAQKSVIAQIFPDAKAGRPVRLFRSHNPDYGDGGQLRDFIWVGDSVAVMLWLYDHPETNGLFNLGSGKARSFLDLAHAIFQALNMEPNIKFIDTPEAIRARYQYFTQAEMSRLRQAGCDLPFCSLEEGVARYVRDYLNTADPYI